MQWLTEYICHEAENSRQKEQHGKMKDVQMFWSLCAECIEFLGQMRSGAVLMESRHGEGQTDKEGLYQRKRSDSVYNLYSIRASMGNQWRVLRRGETWSRLWVFRTSLAAEFWTFPSFSRRCPKAAWEERVTIIKPREDKGGHKCFCRVSWKKMLNCANTAKFRVGRSADVLYVQLLSCHRWCKNQDFWQKKKKIFHSHRQR